MAFASMEIHVLIFSAYCGLIETTLFRTMDVGHDIGQAEMIPDAHTFIAGRPYHSTHRESLVFVIRSLILTLGSTRIKHENVPNEYFLEFGMI